MKVKVKETATFTCELSTENIKPVWLKNGKELTSSKRIEMISEKKTHKLVIHEVTVEDKGEYTCVVGSVSTTAKLVVEGKLPTHFSHLSGESFSSIVGRSVPDFFSCRVIFQFYFLE